MDCPRARTREPDAQIIRGDCRLRLPSVADESIDAIVTDPPYGINLQLRSNRARPLSIAGDGRGEARRLWQGVLPHLARIARPDTAHLFFGTWKSIWIKELLEEHFTVKGCVVWYKNTWGYGWHLRPRWELIWLCHKGNPPVPKKAPPDVWEFKRDHRLLHPCQKPVALLRAGIRLVAPHGGKILDPFAGIGSTGVAAVEENCGFLGIEVAARYAQTANLRIKTARDSRAARDSTPPRTPLKATENPKKKSAPVQPTRAQTLRTAQPSKLRPGTRARA